MNKKKEPEEQKPMPEMKPIPAVPMALPELVSHLEDLVKFALECEDKKLKNPDSFVNIYQQLLDIRKAIQVLTQDQRATLALIENVVQESGEEFPPLSKEDQKIFNKIQHLKEICEAAKERIHTSIQAQPEAEEIIKEELRSATGTKKKKKIHRKGKFRRVGGKKGWLPT